MKIFQKYCQGKSILVKDVQKLSKYIDLCLKSPVSYQGISKSVGYNSIINVQFNSKQFNQTLFPQFINLVGRDLQELNEKEFNYFVQAFSCYVESAFNCKNYDKKFFENIINQMNLNATYVQKCIFLLTITQSQIYEEPIIQSQYLVEQFSSNLMQYGTQTIEENLWKIFIEFSNINEEQINNQGSQFEMTFKKFFNYIELIPDNLSKFTNIMTNFMLIYYLNQVKFFNAQTFDKRSKKFVYPIYTSCQKYIQKNLSSFGSFGLTQYLDYLSKSNDIYQRQQFQIVLDELIQFENFEGMPMQEFMILLRIIIKSGKMKNQLSSRFIKHLYENMNLINPNDYQMIFLFLLDVEDDLKDIFMTKLQAKVIPQNLSFAHNTIILAVLFKCNRIDRNILEKYLVGISTRLNDIDTTSGCVYLQALNSQFQEHPELFSKVMQLKFEDDEDFRLQIEILRYLQQHNPQHEKVYQIQDSILNSLKKNYNAELVKKFIGVLLYFKDISQKKITILPELKEYVKAIIQEAKTQGKLDLQTVEFLKLQYKIQL